MRDYDEPSLDLLTRVDVAYAQYNALKTFTDERESQFVATQIGSMWVTHDVVRNDSYYNRIVGFGRETADQLNDALAQFPEGIDTIQLEVPEDEAATVRPSLQRHQFAKTGMIHWLWRPLKRGANHHVHWCGPEDIDRLRPLFEHGRPAISDALWAARSRYLVTEQLQTFTIRQGDHFLAMATSFFGDDCVLLGNAFTLPEYRNLGFHTRLLTARLNRAYERRYPEPVTFAFVDVQPGTVSEKNCLKKGFRPFVMMEKWERGQTDDG